MVKKVTTQKKKSIPKGHANPIRDQFTVVLEDLRSQFQIFGEGLVGVHQKLDEHGERLDSIDAKLDEHGERLTNVESGLTFVKEQLSIIRHNQVTRDEFHLLETRVARLERTQRV